MFEIKLYNDNSYIKRLRSLPFSRLTRLEVSPQFLYYLPRPNYQLNELLLHINVVKNHQTLGI